jgi:hypothetical protein
LIAFWWQYLCIWSLFHHFFGFDQFPITLPLRLIDFQAPDVGIGSFSDYLTFEFDRFLILNHLP